MPQEAPTSLHQAAGGAGRTRPSLEPLATKGGPPALPGRQ
jgi:hypothetical protein